MSSCQSNTVVLDNLMVNAHASPRWNSARISRSLLNACLPHVTPTDQQGAQWRWLVTSHVPDLRSFLGALIVEEEVDLVDSLVVGSSEPQRQLGGLPW